MEINSEEKEFVRGYASALQDIMLKLTGTNGCSKSYDPCTFDNNNTLHSYAFDLKDGGRRHLLSNYKDVNELTQLMLKEAVEWCKSLPIK